MRFPCLKRLRVVFLLRRPSPVLAWRRLANALPVRALISAPRRSPTPPGFYDSARARLAIPLRSLVDASQHRWSGSRSPHRHPLCSCSMHGSAFVFLCRFILCNQDCQPQPPSAICHPHRLSLPMNNPQAPSELLNKLELTWPLSTTTDLSDSPAALLDLPLSPAVTAKLQASPPSTTPPPPLTTPYYCGEANVSLGR